RLKRDVDIGQLLELVIHAGQLLLNVLGGGGNTLLNPGDVEKDAAVRRTASFAHLAPNATRHVIARQQLRRAPRVLVALGIAPTFLLRVGSLIDIQRRDVL